MTIEELRTKIRQDMMDYKLLWSDSNSGDCWLFKSDVFDEGSFEFFDRHLADQIEINLGNLKEMLENQNEK